MIFSVLVAILYASTYVDGTAEITACPAICLANGAVKGGRSIGDKVTFSCDPLYTLSGSIESTCLSSGKWSRRKPYCKYIATCPSIVALPVRVVKEYVGGEKYNLPGGKIKWGCKEGMDLVGNDVMTCTENGKWDSRPPVCKASRCSVFDKLVNGLITKQDSTRGGEVHFECNKGYKAVGKTVLTCGDDRKWSGEKPVCEVANTCPHIYDFYGGTLSTTDAIEGTTVTFTCDVGFELHGASSITCLGTKWSAPLPECKYARCKYIPLWWHGKLDRSFDENGVERQLEVKCKEGYKVFGSNILKCVNNYWTKPFPKCTYNLCRAVTKFYGGVVKNFKRTIGSTYTVECDKGYKLSSSVNYATCQENKEWTSYPRCKRDYSVDAEKECYDIPAIYDGKCVGGKKEGDVRTCSCNKGYTLQGASTLKCVNGNWDKDLPKCVDNRCPFLSAVYGGKTDGDDNFTGANVTYSCYDGFELVGTKTLTCMANKKWSAKPPMCIRYKCRNLVKIQNGDVKKSGDKYIATCHPGYKLVGPSEVYCKDRRWLPETPRCVVHSCTPVQFIHNGKLSGSSYEVGAKLKVECIKDYTLVGPSEIVCRDDYTWSPSPKCSGIFCHGVWGLKKGKVITNGYTPGSTASFVCDPYYELDGPEKVTCQANGRWSDENPTCKPKQQCPLVCWDEGQIEYSGKYVGDKMTFTCPDDYMMKGEASATCSQNGTWSAEPPLCEAPPKGKFKHSACSRPILRNGCASGGRYPGDKVNYKCDVGYVLDGVKTATCQPFGVWSDPIPVCKYVRKCPYMIGVYGGFVERVGGENHNLVGGKVRYTCIEGFTLIGNAEITCKENGDWSSKPPTCTKYICSAFGYLKNGWIIQQANVPGGTVTFRCNTGYKLVGKSKLNCDSDRQWDGVKPTCEVNTCPTIYSFDNGKVSTSEITEGTTVTFTCDAGYKLIGASSITCRDNNWSDKVPTCKYMRCRWIPFWWRGTVHRGQPDSNGVINTVDIKCKDGYKASTETTLKCVNNFWTKPFPACRYDTCRAVYTFSRGTVSNYQRLKGNTFTVTCDEGYKLENGLATSTCQENGQWTRYPRCIKDNGATQGPDECVDIVDLSYGKCVGGKKHGDVRECSCEPGYVLKGVTKVTCVNGKWDNPLPKCESHMCPFLPAFIYGRTEGNENYLGSKVSYTCNEGYKLVGPKTITCMANKQWSSKPPYCKKNICPVMVGIRYGRYEGSGNNQGDILKVTCNDGYKLVGHSTINCDYGRWKPYIPKCVRNACTPEQFVYNGKYIGSDYRIGAKLRLQCDPGYTPLGPSVITCQSNFYWDASPKCVYVACKSLGGITRGRAINYNTKPGSVVTFKCDESYKLEGAEKVTCQADGQWSDPIPTCKAETRCPTIYFNGHVNYTAGKSVGDKVHFSCDHKLYTLVGSASATCMPDGEWSEDIPKCFSPWDKEPCKNMLMDVMFVVDKSKSIDNLELSMERDIVTGLIKHFDIGPGKTKVGLVSYGKTAEIEFGLNKYQSTEAFENVDVLPRTKAKAGSYLHKPLPMMVEEFRKEKRENVPQLVIVVGDGRSSSPAETKVAINRLHEAGIPVIVIGVGFDATRKELSYFATGNSESNVFVVDSPDEIDGMMGHVAKHVCAAGPQKASYVHCPRVFLKNGMVEGRRTWLHSVSLTCDEGYQLVGEASMTCGPNGVWNRETPTCEKYAEPTSVTCPALSSAHGYFDYRGRKPGGRIYHACDKGFHFSDKNSVGTCQSDGTWSSKQHSCVSMSQSACKGKDIDVFFVVDISNAINWKNLDRVRTYVMDYVEEYDYSTARVGVIAFSGDAYIDLPLAKYDQPIRNMFLERSKIQNTRRLDLALELLLKAGTFPDANRVRTAIVLQNRASSDSSATLAAAKKVHAAGINVHVLGYSRAISASEMKAVSSSGNTATFGHHKDLLVSGNTSDFMMKTCEA